MASVATPSPQNNSTPRFRNKSASPWVRIRHSPYLTNPLLPKPPTFSLALPTPNPLYQPLIASEPSSTPAPPTKVVRLKLPFTLRPDGEGGCTPTSEQFDELKSHFPTLYYAAYHHPVLVLGVEVLPAKRWPTFVADVPLWLTTTPGNLPFMKGAYARSFNKFNVKGSIVKYHDPETETVEEIFHLVNGKGANVGAYIEELQWDGVHFFGLGQKDPKSGWQNSLPRSINDFAISYIWGKDASREFATRKKFPSKDGQLKDDSDYTKDDLRPGVLLGGIHRNGDSILVTTSGICVESLSGEKYITVAAHGFPGEGKRPIYQPMPFLGSNNQPDPRNQIGFIHRVIDDDDIALAKLLPGIKYSAETFSEPNEPAARPFRELRDPKEKKHGDTVFLNSPVNGLCEGAHVTTAWMRIKEENKELYLNKAIFSYFGNDSEEFFDGCCGAVFWDDNFDVLGQFRFQDTETKFVYGPTFEKLRNNGYKLSSI